MQINQKGAKSMFDEKNNCSYGLHVLFYFHLILVNLFGGRTLLSPAF